MRAYLPGTHEDAGVSHQESVRLKAAEESQIAVRLIKILVVSQDVDSHIDLHASVMCPGNARAHIFFRKIARLGAQ
jgi:hypothetical protein